MRWLVRVALIGWVGSVGCGNAGETDDAMLSKIEVTLSASTARVAQPVTATAIGIDRDGGHLALSTVAWSSSDASIASIDDRGAVTTLAAGTATITATSGGLTGTADLTVATSSALTACRLPGPQFGIGLGFPRIAGRLPSTGDVRVKVLFVDFSDAVATRTPQEVFSIISPGAEQFYDAVSYGRMHLVFDPHDAWLRMSKPTTGYPWNPLTFAVQKGFIQEAANLATGVDFATSNAIVVMANPDTNAFPNGPAFTANPGDGVSVGGKVFDNGATSGADLTFWGSYWFNHEFGHTMSLVDLYDFTVSTNPEIFHYTGDFSMMGNIAGTAREYLAWERWLLGWITDDQVVCAQHGHTTATLGPVEAMGGTKLVVVPTGATTAVVVESRHALGYDGALPKAGLLVYAVDTSVATGHGTVKVLPIADGDVHKLTAPLGVAQSLGYAGVTVTFASQDTTGDHVDIVY